MHAKKPIAIACLIPDIEAALSYSGAKSDQLSFLQNSAWKDQGIKQFIEGKLPARQRPV